MNTQAPDQAPPNSHEPPPQSSFGHYAGRFRPPRKTWLAAAATGLLAILLAAAIVTTHANTATLVTQFGRPVRVITDAGLHFKLPAPIERAIPVDLRLHVTSSDPQDAATKDDAAGDAAATDGASHNNQRILVQAFVAWQVGGNSADIQTYVAALRNDPAEAGNQIRSLINATLQITTPGYTLAALVGTAPGEHKLTAFETELRARLAPRLRTLYGIEIRELGVESLSLPEPALSAALAQMRAARDTIAAQRTAEADRQAAQIRADATRDSRILIANAQTQAAQIEAGARVQAAEIEAHAYSADPALYTLLRSLDTLGNVIGPNTRLVLRTDAAPFNVLVNGPPADAANK